MYSVGHVLVVQLLPSNAKYLEVNYFIWLRLKQSKICLPKVPEMKFDQMLVSCHWYSNRIEMEICHFCIDTLRHGLYTKFQFTREMLPSPGGIVWGLNRTTSAPDSVPNAKSQLFTVAQLLHVTDRELVTRKVRKITTADAVTNSVIPLLSPFSAHEAGSQIVLWECQVWNHHTWHGLFEEPSQKRAEPRRNTELT